jgi:hypothetical protein
LANDAVVSITSTWKLGGCPKGGVLLSCVCTNGAAICAGSGVPFHGESQPAKCKQNALSFEASLCFVPSLAWQSERFFKGALECVSRKERSVSSHQ